MIKLTLHPNTPSANTVIFLKDKLVIGAQADLSLPGEDLADAHIQISEKESRFIIANMANDPFATLNGEPFGKRTLNNHDLIQIGKTIVLFEGTLEAEKSSPSMPLSTEKEIVEIVDYAIQEKKIEALSSLPSGESTKKFDWRKELETLEEFSPKDEPTEAEFDIEELVREAEALQWEVQASEDHSSEEIQEEVDDEPKHVKRTEEERNKLTMKDYYLHEFDDELENWKKEESAHEPLKLSIFQNKWRKLILILIGIFIICTLVAGSFYLTVSGTSNKEELRASEAVADIAMALAYAQVNHVRPVNQNWSDPEFLKANLSNVLSSKHSTLAHVDSLGKFVDCPYILRIYTSPDFSQFIVMAQPVPSLQHWLIPKATVIVDSKAMEMRKITDLKALNRLLFNSTTLEGSHAREISALVKQGELIPLSRLTHPNNRMSFSPPKALEFLRPGSENFIYNAPRYHPFAEFILAKSLQLVHNPDNSHEVNLLRQDLDAIGFFPNLVLYSSEGLQMALKQQKALGILAPHKKFLVAYLKSNPAGTIISSHLLLDNEGSEDNKVIADNKHVDPYSYMSVPPTLEHDLNTTTTFNKQPQPELKEIKRGIDTTHPLYMQLNALMVSRLQQLKPLADEMVNALNKQNQELNSDFMPHFHQMLAHYEHVSEELELRLVKQLIELYKNHPEMPVAQFVGFVRAVGLGAIAKQPLKEQAELLGNHILKREDLENGISAIHNSTSLEELESHVHIVTSLLTLEKLPEPERLMLWQNEVRGHVQHKIGELLFSPTNALSNDKFSDKARSALSNILKSAWVTDPDEYAFYLTEFDFRNHDAQEALSKF